jgi:hypothetical protein
LENRFLSQLLRILQAYLFKGSNSVLFLKTFILVVFSQAWD